MRKRLDLSDVKNTIVNTAQNSVAEKLGLKRLTSASRHPKLLVSEASRDPLQALASHLPSSKQESV